MTAPVSSVSLPVMVPRPSCAAAAPWAITTKRIGASTFIRMTAIPLLELRARRRRRGARRGLAIDGVPFHQLDPRAVRIEEIDLPFAIHADLNLDLLPVHA